MAPKNVILCDSLEYGVAFGCEQSFEHIITVGFVSTPSSNPDSSKL